MLYLTLVRKTTTVLERTGRFSYRYALVSGGVQDPWSYAWGTRGHARRKAKRALRRYLREAVDAADRNEKLTQSWTFHPEP